MSPTCRRRSKRNLYPIYSKQQHREYVLIVWLISPGPSLGVLHTVTSREQGYGLREGYESSSRIRKTKFYPVSVRPSPNMLKTAMQGVTIIWLLSPMPQLNSIAYYKAGNRTMGWDKAINLALLDEYIDPDNSFLLTVSLACLLEKKNNFGRY